MMLSNQKKLNKTKRITLLLSLSACICTTVFVQSCEEKTVPIVTNETEKVDVTTPSTQAEYVGGVDSLYAYLGRSISYPKGDTNEGTVRMRFVINESGDVNEVTIIQGVSPRLDSTAIAVINNMPKWIPAKSKDGKGVKSYYNLPLDFQMK